MRCPFWIGLGRASTGDEIVEVLIVGLGGFGSKGFVGGPIRQLTVGLGKVVILVLDDSRIIDNIINRLPTQCKKVVTAFNTPYDAGG